MVACKFDIGICISVDDSIPVYASPEGVACVPIPIDRSSGRDYSSLEVVWPEESNHLPGRLCYCPPYEGEQRLFSRCISTVSCNTSYTIVVSDGTVCFSQLSQGLAAIPLYFTLLEFCPDHSCVVRSVLTSFSIHTVLGTWLSGEVVKSNKFLLLLPYF